MSRTYTHVIHPFPPLIDTRCELLILGSLPSVKSREQMFFYGHPQNRFWPLLAAVFGERTPETIDEKKTLALRHHIALWDTIYSCDIVGSGDSSIRNVTPTDLRALLDAAPIRRIFCNGRTSGMYYHRYQEKVLHIPAVTLPSTSPANAAWSMQRLLEVWKTALEVCE